MTVSKSPHPTRGLSPRTFAKADDLSTHERGRATATPSDLRGEPWTRIAWRVVEGIQNDRVMLVAAGVTFYGLLALFPATAAVVSLCGLFTDATTINSQLGLISGFLPQGALEVIGDQVSRITAQGRGTLGFAFLGSLAVSLWGANAGTKAIFQALNIIYDEREKRSFVQLTLISLAFTLGAIVVVVLAMGGIVIVPIAFKFLGAAGGLGVDLLSLLRWPLLCLVILLALACLYRFGPSRTRPRWRWISWGSAIAAATWVVGSLLLSWYVASFGTYNATYGSLGAVIGFLVWMWLSTIVILGGAEIDAALEQAEDGGRQGTDTPQDAITLAADHGYVAGKQQTVAANFMGAHDASIKHQPMARLAMAGTIGFVLGVLWKT